MTQSIKTSGILLHVIPYLGQKKILKVLTAEYGLISLFANKTTLTPFCLAEWVFLKNQREIYSLQDSTLIDPLLELRQDYNTLSSAGAMAQDLLRTQFPNKKAPLNLAYAYLKKLPLNPFILSASFRLKLLLHEGLLSEERDSSFTPSEWEEVCILAFSRQFSTIQEQKNAPYEKIKNLFEERT